MFYPHVPIAPSFCRFFPKFLFAIIFGLFYSTSFYFNDAQGQVLFLNTTIIPNITWRPPGLGQFRVGDERMIWLLVNSNETSWSGPVEITCEYAMGCPLEECSIVHQIRLDRANEFTEALNISLKGTFIGLNRLFARIGKKQFWYRIRIWKTHLGSHLTKLFIIALGIAIVVGNFIAGLQLQPGLITKYGKLLALSAICQFLIVPMIAFCIAKYLLGAHLFVVRLAFFLVACTPTGAGKSAFWSVLFDGNLELVAAITFMQRVGTFIFMPIWLHFMGRPAFFVERVHITWNAIVYAVALMMVPFLLGMFLARIGVREFIQRGANFVKIFLWLSILLFLIIVIPAIWSNLRLLTWDLFLQIGLVLPCASHCVAFLLTKLFHLNQRDIRTMTIECGIQSSGLAALILLLSLGEPERDVALSIPIAFALLTDKPLLALCFGRIGRRAFAVLKGANNQVGVVTDGNEKHIAPSKSHQSPSNRQSPREAINNAFSNSTQQIAKLLEQNLLIRVKQMNEKMDPIQ